MHQEGGAPDHSHIPLSEVQHSSGDCVVLGNQRFLRKDLVRAFGGDANPDSVHRAPTRTFGNPAPLGLSLFAVCCFVLLCINAGAMGITIPSVMILFCFFYGGIAQFVAGMWLYVAENTFGATAFGLYGCFWFGYGAILLPTFGISAAYEGHEEQLKDAIGFFLLGWTLFTFMNLTLVLKLTLAFALLFFFLFMTFLLLTIGQFTGKAGVNTAGGVFGVITLFILFYNAYAGIANPQNSFIVLKSFPLSREEV